MNDKIKTFFKISEDLNNNLIDNIFELNINNANLIHSQNKSNDNSDLSNLSINVSNLEISKLVQLFKINKKALKDFFKYEIFEFRTAEELITIILEFTEIFDNNIFEKVLEFSIENNHLVNI